MSLREDILASLPAEEKEIVLKLANEFRLGGDDPAWLLAALAGNWKNWMERETADAAQAREAAIRHIRAQHKTSVEQLQAAAVAASRAAEAEIKKSAAEFTKTLAENIREAIRQAAAGESVSDKAFRFIAPIVSAVGAVVVVVGFGLMSGYINPPATDEQLDAAVWYQALAKHWEQIPLEVRQEIQATEAAKRAAKGGRSR